MEILTAIPARVHTSLAAEWIKEANMNLPSAKSSGVDFGKELMMDLIEYTNVVDGESVWIK